MIALLVGVWPTIICAESVAASDSSGDLAASLPLLLREQADTALQRYATQQGWQHFEVEHQVWLAPAAKNLPPCELPLNIHVGNGYQRPWGRLPYTIECLQPSWRLNARIDSKLTLPVWVTATPLQRGQRLQPGDVIAQPIDISRLIREPIPAEIGILGRVVARKINAGKVIGPLDLQKDWLVLKGESVIIRASSTQFSVSAQGEALDNGVLGDTIKVLNTRSGKIVQVRITAPGEVHTHF